MGFHRGNYEFNAKLTSDCPRGCINRQTNEPYQIRIYQNFPEEKAKPESFECENAFVFDTRGNLICRNLKKTKKTKEFAICPAYWELTKSKKR